MSEIKQKKVDTVRLQNMSRAFIASASLFAAIDHELFSAIATGANTVEGFANSAGISEINAERLMTMCAASDLIHWVDDHYENADDVQRFLVKGEKSYAASWLTFTRPGWENWGKLGEKLQNQEAPTVIGSYDTMTVEYARKYHEATSSVGFGSGRRFIKHVDLSKRTKVMDLGGGSGAYSIVAAQAHPNLSAVVFDLPPVAEVTKEFIARNNVESQVSAQGGDFTKDEFPANCDVAIMASNLPQYNREIIQQVISKAFNALLPGGEMHLIGEMLDDDRQGPLDAAIWGLMEALSNSTGMTHTRADCVGYFEQAGFESVVVHEFIPGILVRVCGLKPE
jgi:SAM-dependent methyltransferase